jgi:hypothetical protein
MLEKLAHRWPRSEPCLKISLEHEGAMSFLSGNKRSTLDGSVDRGAAEAGDGAYLFNGLDPRIGGTRHFVSPGSTGVLNTGLHLQRNGIDLLFARGGNGRRRTGASAFRAASRFRVLLWAERRRRSVLLGPARFKCFLGKITGEYVVDSEEIRRGLRTRQQCDDHIFWPRGGRALWRDKLLSCLVH